MDHLIPAKRPSVNTKKVNLSSCAFCSSGGPQNENKRNRMKIKESEKIDNYLDLARELKKLKNMSS